MSSKIEETRREMYRLLAHLKANPTGVVLMAEFETAMEAHLEVLRQKPKASARVAELKTWLRSTVRDNKRLRIEAKALKETQEEIMGEVERLNRELVSREGIQDRARVEFVGHPIHTVRVTAGVLSEGFGLRLADLAKERGYFSFGDAGGEYVHDEHQSPLKNRVESMKSGVCGVDHE